MNISLNEVEINYLKKTLKVDTIVYDISACSHQEGDLWILSISEEAANDIRDLCGARLQSTGFDENYAPTQEGILLEKLIDKFYTG